MEPCLRATAALISPANSGCGRVEIGAVGVGDAGPVARRLADDALQAQAPSEEWDAVLTGEGDGRDLALDTAVTEAAGHADRVHVGELRCRARRGLAVVRGD